jgi:hypothetical protein
MSSWTVIPCLLALRGEYDKLAPNRDKGADGTIGDSSHTSSSDHTPDEDSSKLENKDSDHANEVHALDIDSGLNSPDGRSFKDIFLDIIELERQKWNAPDDKCRLNYAIFDRKIYDKDNDFAPEDYTGSDPHTGHAHFSARYETSCEEDTRPWGVIGDVVTPEDIEAIAKATWTRKLKNPLFGKNGDTREFITAEDFQRYPDVLHGNTQGVVRSEAQKVLAAIDALPTGDENAAAVVAALGQDDPEALADALRRFLSPEQVEALRLAL